jgi:hypothetical protein
MWWNSWGGDEDDPNPAPLLCAFWKMWRALDDAWFWFWWKKLWPISKSLSDLRQRLFPRPIGWYVDEEGLGPWEWLLIAIGELWNMGEHDDRFIYDRSVKSKWDEFLKARATGDDTERADEA